jgi:hypothetical protein
MERPTIEEVCAKVVENTNVLHNLPKTKHKGMPGNYLESLTGIQNIPPQMHKNGPLCPKRNYCRHYVIKGIARFTFL